MDHLLTEARNPASTNLDELAPLDFVRLMSAEDSRVPPAVAAQEEAIARAIEVIGERLQRGGRLLYAGAGTSGRLGVLDATECPPTFNSPPGQVVGVIAGGSQALTQAVEGAEDHPEFAEKDLESLQLGPGDVVVGIATSGRTPYVLGAVAYARRLGAFTIGLSCNPDSELIAPVDLAITVVVGPEVLSGSTRLKAGTATKLVLNMLTTGAMVRLGKTYGNLMVDLRATNDKLRARTNRIVRQLTGVSAEEADNLLESCGGELKTALVARLAGVTPEQARQLLQKAGGQVRRALIRKDEGGRLKDEKVPRVVSSFNLPASSLFLGIDGGGSHTVALLAREQGPRAWTILGRGQAGPSNVHAVGVASALSALDQAVAGAFRAAGVERGRVASASLGLAGADRPAERERLLGWAASVGLAERVDVTNDAALLLAAGTPDGWGLALVAGTGSIVYGRASDGRTARAGGWGALLGDEGSGYAIALAGLQAVTRAADGRGPETALTLRLLRHLGLEQAAQLIPLVYGGSLDRAGLAALAPIVFDAAAEGDKVAGDIVGDAAGSLAQTAAAVANKLAWIGRQVPLALTGGMLLTYAGYRQQLLEALRIARVEGPVTLVAEPAEGAVRRAMVAADT